MTSGPPGPRSAAAGHAGGALVARSRWTPGARRRASSRRSCDVPTPANPRRTWPRSPRCRRPSAPATAPSTGHQPDAEPDAGGRCVREYRPGGRTSKPASGVPLSGLRGHRRDILDVLGPLLPQPQLDHLLGERELELLVLRPTLARLDEPVPPVGERRRRHPVPTRRLRHRHLTRNTANTTRNRSSTSTVRPGFCDLLMTAILPGTQPEDPDRKPDSLEPSAKWKQPQ